MNLFKKKWFWIIAVILVVIIIVFASVSSKEDVNYVTEKATIQDLVQTVEVTGSVESADDIDLNFSTSGRLAAVLVGVGDEVEVGQILARLSSGSVASQVEDARAALDVARSNLDQLMAGASTLDLQVTEEEVASARTTHQAKIDILENLENTRDNELESLREVALNIIKDKYFVIQYSLDIIYDSIMDGDADQYLYVGDTTSLTQAKALHSDATLAYQGLGNLITQANETNLDSDIIIALASLENILEEVADSLNYTLTALRTAIENSVYTDTVIDAYKSGVNAQSTVVNTAITSVQNSASDINTRKLYYETSIIDAQNNVESALASLNLAEARLGLKGAPPRDFEIAAAEANVRRAQATLNRYLSNWSDTVIKAPVDGIVTEINFDVGEQSSMATPVVSMIGLSTMQIEVDVPESDITKVELNDEVEITLDAFSSEDKFVGTVTFVDPAATNIDGVIYYQVKIIFNEKDNRIKSGMTADITISTESREGVLAVPSRAVVYREDGKYIQILENGLLTEKEVTTGLKGDGGVTEVVSGIEEGADVITFIKDSK
ncbi:efflux RND transporter periplasmic adaptor subunit [Candidatus Parcubacteria bacterium]|mgnify:CR=1 FL=1|jgi:HlyD family secretion protein|nr:efflux RND transporter periplasmic adaptor subunit [Candidatus Parcubacteria bacterium]